MNVPFSDSKLSWKGLKGIRIALEAMDVYAQRAAQVRAVTVTNCWQCILKWPSNSQIRQIHCMVVRSLAVCTPTTISHLHLYCDQPSYKLRNALRNRNPSFATGGVSVSVAVGRFDAGEVGQSWDCARWRVREPVWHKVCGTH